MASYVCSQLSNPNVITGQRTCQAWAESTSFADQFAITTAQANEIAINISLIFIICWCAIVVAKRLR